ncbi:glycosyltransferase family 4 protein [Dyadobacter crusticola]|uniref:glycosyltransferase family 4 protein n=1 Tax=Dyadobacter crusticola TaxID=292407 RepID=UPI0004E12DF7|nr:glycosyltransferase family 4 protein [Dyadobacter crusticola]
MKSSILFVLHIPPPVHGAAMAGTFIRNSALINDEFDTTYINLSTSTHLKESGKGSFKKLGALLNIQYRVISALIRRNYDLCYVTLNASGPGFYKDMLIVAICKLFGKKIIYHFHNKGVDTSKKTRINDFLYRYAFNNAFSILISKYLYSDVKNYAKQSNVFFCAYGIPESTETAKVHTQIAESESPCRLLFLSNMMQEKGVYVLAEACKILKERGLQFECNFVGAWSDVTKEAFEIKVKELGLEKMVFGHGAKYNSDKLAFFNNSDVFVFPTYYHYETFGIVNLEAMQHSLPVVSCPEGGIPDIVVDGQTGYLVPQKDVNALADKLEILILNPELRKAMGKEAKARFEQYFRLETFETNIRDILKTAIAENPS